MHRYADDWTLTRRVSAPALCALLLAGCALDVPAEPEVDAEREIGSTQEAIRNGTVIAQANSGILKLESNSGNCSGTLLKNRWVLTAAHCVNLLFDRDFSSAFEGQHLGSHTGVQIHAAKFDASGRLILAGALAENGLGARFYLTRFTSTGAVDTTFGWNGEVVTDLLLATDESIEDMAIDSLGRIVVTGWAFVGGKAQFATVRYASNGALDFFGTFGGVQTDIPNSDNEIPHAVVTDSLNRIIVVGQAANPNSFVVARYTAAGALDTTFGTGTPRGVVQISLGANRAGWAEDVTMDGDRIVVVGRSFGSEETAVIARFTGAGAPDPSFGTGGMTFIPRTQFSFNSANAVLMQGTKILVGGSMSRRAAVWRLTSSGSVDPTFGSGGVAQPVIGGWESDVVEMALASGNAIRLGIAADEITSDKLRMAYAKVGVDGALTPERIFVENNGVLFDSQIQGLAEALAVSGTRVVVAGTNNPYSSGGFSTAGFFVLQPDRTEDTTFTGAVTVKMDTYSQSADRAYYSNSGDDVALLHLPAGVPMNGSTTNYTFPGFASNLPGLISTDVTCRGYGADILNPDGSVSQSVNPPPLRVGTSRVTQLNTWYIWARPLPAPAVQQEPLPGDSGGSCRTSSNLLIGVTSRGGGALVRADRVATWATAQIANP